MNDIKLLNRIFVSYDFRNSYLTFEIVRDDKDTRFYYKKNSEYFEVNENYIMTNKPIELAEENIIEGLDVLPLNCLEMYSLFLNNSIKNKDDSIQPFISKYLEQYKNHFKWDYFDRIVHNQDKYSIIVKSNNQPIPRIQVPHLLNINRLAFILKIVNKINHNSL